MNSYQSINSDFEVYPFPINIMQGFKDYPDEILNVLQLATDYSLTPEQATIAKLSALKLCSNWEITVLDLVETWTAMPNLTEFAARLSKAFLT